LSRKKNFDIVCFGECAIDHISRVSQKRTEGFPMRISSCKTSFGGRGLNFVNIAGIFTQEVLLISAVGDDYASSGLKRHLMKKGICDSRFYRTKKSGLPQAFIYNSNSDGTVYFYPGLRLKAEKKLKNHLDQCINSLRAKIIYCTSSDPGLNYRLLKDFSGELKAFAPGQELFLYSNREITANLAYADILFLNKIEAHLLEKNLRKGIEKILVDYDLDFIVVTLGGKGSRVISKKETLNIPACAAGKTVDETGAGDGFAAAFLATYLSTSDLNYSARIAGVTSSFLLEAHGSPVDLPDYEIILKRYKKANL